MFTLYHSNQLDLLQGAAGEPHPAGSALPPLRSGADPGAESRHGPVAQAGAGQGVRHAANIDFPLPASFIWEMFTRVLADVPRQSPYNKGP